MPGRNTLEGPTRYREDLENYRDNPDKKEQLRLAAYTFFDKMEERNPALIEDLSNLAGKKSRSNQQNQTDWQHDNHNQWTSQEDSKAARDIMTSFQAATDGLDQEATRTAAEHLSSFLTSDTDLKLLLDKNLDTTMTEEFRDDLKSRLHNARDTLVDSLAEGDALQIQQGIQQLQSVQKEIQNPGETTEHQTTGQAPAEEHQTGYDDPDDTSSKMKRGAEDFLQTLHALDPELDTALLNIHENRHMSDQQAREAREQRAPWEWHNTPITDWDKTAHFRNDNVPPWMQGDQTENAICITESFHQSMQDLTIQESQAAAHQVADLLTMPINEQLNALRGDQKLNALLTDTDPDLDNWTRQVKDNLAEGLTLNDDHQVQSAIMEMNAIQNNFNKLDTRLEQEATRGYTPRGPQEEHDTQSLETSEREQLIHQKQKDSQDREYKDQSIGILEQYDLTTPYRDGRFFVREGLVEKLVNTLWEKDPALVERISQDNFHNNQYLEEQKDWDMALVKTVNHSHTNIDEQTYLHHIVREHITSQAKAEGENILQMGLTWKQDNTNTTDQLTAGHPDPYWAHTGEKLSEEEYAQITMEGRKQLQRLEYLVNSPEWSTSGPNYSTDKDIKKDIKTLREILQGTNQETLQQEEEQTEEYPAKGSARSLTGRIRDMLNNALGSTQDDTQETS